VPVVNLAFDVRVSGDFGEVPRLDGEFFGVPWELFGDDHVQALRAVVNLAFDVRVPGDFGEVLDRSVPSCSDRLWAVFVAARIPK
jgi:hypothetical protein